MTSSDDGIWTFAIILSGVLSLSSLISFTKDATSEEGFDWLLGQKESGMTRSISQMIVDSEPYVQGRGIAGSNVSMAVILAHFLHNVYPRYKTAYRSFPKATKAIFASFIIATCSAQSVVAITYLQGVFLHFFFAGLFYLFATVISVTSSYLEFKTRTATRTLPSKLRLSLVSLSTILMLTTWFLAGLSTITYPDISRIDRRPPVIWAELLGVLGFLFYCCSLIPYLQTYGDGEDTLVFEQRKEKEESYL
jgi:hypothetical protein